MESSEDVKAEILRQQPPRGLVLKDMIDTARGMLRDLIVFAEVNFESDQLPYRYLEARSYEIYRGAAEVIKAGPPAESAKVIILDWAGMGAAPGKYLVTVVWTTMGIKIYLAPWKDREVTVCRVV